MNTKIIALKGKGMCLNQKKEIANSSIIGSERNGMGCFPFYPQYSSNIITEDIYDPKAELIKEVKKICKEK